MKYTTIAGAALLCALFIGGTANAAIYIKYDGVEGESTTAAPAPTRLAPTEDPEEAQVDAFLKIPPIEGEALKSTGIEPDEIDAKATDDDSEEKKGNVEYTWKVEEGEKSEEGDPDRPVITGSVPNDEKEEEDVDDIKRESATTTAPKGGISVAAGDVNGLTEEEKEQFLETVKMHAEVRSEQDLENFAKGVLLQDTNVKEVFADDEVLGIGYRSQGKLFGFIPVSFTQKVLLETEGEAKGRVKIKLPWFSFLIKKETVTGEEIEEEAKKDRGKDWIEIESWSFEEKAQAFTTLSNILKTKHDTAKNSISNIR